MKKVIGEHTVIDEDVSIGDNVFIGNNVTIRSGCKIQDGVVIGHNTVLEKDVFVGAHTRIQAQVYLSIGTHVGRKVFIGPQVCAINDERIVSHGRGEFIPDAPVIEDYARIGACVLLFPGVVIGFNALVGAGSKVTKDVKSREVWYGNAASLKGTVPDEEIIDG